MNDLEDRHGLLEEARAWVAEDPDPTTRAELEELIARVTDGGDPGELRERFAGPLGFGTSGLRAPMGAGPQRMNRVVVLRAAAGLAGYLHEVSPGRDTTVVVGYDARHHSAQFARDTAEVLTGAGLRTWVLPRALPTPVLAYAIRELGCAAGVMVTASHNPAADNGYKVYLGDGSQVAPPADADLARHIAAVGPLADIPRGGPGRLLDEDVIDRYLDTVAGLAADGPRDLDLVYTPLHGVGGGCVLEVLETAGFSAPWVVAEQEQPDPDFPTTPSPNPELPGVLDLAIALAGQHHADLVVATDPDADRLAVAVPAPDGWQVLRGDEIGALLAGHLLASGRRGRYAASVVSSSLLRAMALSAGQPFAETPTGFKWLGRVPDLAFAYEESLGYCVDPEHVRDKDGISALVLLCEIAAAAKAAGRTLVDLLDDLAVDFGLHATGQVSLPMAGHGPQDAMARLRAAPPTTLGGLAVEEFHDLSLGSAHLPPIDLLRFGLAGDARVMVRPSGTEPLLKGYLEVVAPVADRAALPVARAAADERLAAIDADLRRLLTR